MLARCAACLCCRGSRFQLAFSLPGKDCQFSTMAKLWGDRSFGAAHWAPEYAGKGVTASPSLRMQQVLFHAALCRTRDPSEARTSSNTNSVSEVRARVSSAGPREAIPEEEVLEAPPLPPRTASAHDFTSRTSHPFIQQVRWRKVYGSERRVSRAAPTSARFQESRAGASARAAQSCKHALNVTGGCCII
jgi:hypothetical protein